MDEYDTITVRGKLRYRKNKKIVGKNTLPREIMERYGLIGEKQEVEQGNPLTDRSCIFCGVHSRFTRLVNLQTVYVCDEHYYSQNIGKCAQRLKEIQNEKESHQEISQDDETAEEGHDPKDEQEDGLLDENETTRQGDSESVGAEVHDRQLQEN